MCERKDERNSEQCLVFFPAYCLLEAETVVNQAKAYQNAQIPKAEGQADQLIQNAEYLKQARINEPKTGKPDVT